MENKNCTISCPETSKSWSVFNVQSEVQKILEKYPHLLDEEELKKNTVIVSFGKYQGYHRGHNEMHEIIMKVCNELKKRASDIGETNSSIDVEIATTTTDAFTKKKPSQKNKETYIFSTNTKKKLITYCCEDFELQVKISAYSNPFSATKTLLQKYDKILWFCGGDRVDTYKKMFNKQDEITVIGLPVDNEERNLNSGYSGTYFRELIKALDAYDKGYRTRYGINKFGNNYNKRSIENEFKRISPKRYSFNQSEKKKDAYEISEILKNNLRRIKKNYSKNIPMNNSEHRPLKKLKHKTMKNNVSLNGLNHLLSEINPLKIKNSIKSIVGKSKKAQRK